MLPVVDLIPGTEQDAGEGRKNAFRALVRFPDGTMSRAFVKRLDPSGVAAEAFCAVLLRGWGLAVPAPALVQEESLAFASLDAGFPNLKQRLGLTNETPIEVQEHLVRLGARIVAGLAQTPLAIAADEAVQNFDRNIGNILWDGKDAAWIDHEQALGVGDHEDANKLVRLMTMGTDFSRIEQAAVAISFTLSRRMVDEAAAACANLQTTKPFGALVADRLQSLAGHVLARFPQPDDLFKVPENAV